MKKILIVILATAAAVSSCKVSNLTSYADDVYADPVEEKKKVQLAAAEKAKQEALEEQRIAEERAAQKAKEDANPYYQDPNYNRDDYYDYQYASRLNRFQNPVMGASYYDPYYTNIYTYNQNPAMWGTSIYSTYNYGMPSPTFNNYSMGISTGWGYGNYGYNNFGYNNYGYTGFGYYNDPFYCNSGFGNPYYGYGNYGYGYPGSFYQGYNAGYYNGYNNAMWGYYNSFDPNSTYSQMVYAPRGSNGGGNTRTRTSAGMDVPVEGAHQRYVQSVADQQSNTPRFTNSTERNGNSGRGSSGNSGTYAPSNNGTNSGQPSNDRVTNRRSGAPVSTEPAATNPGNPRNDRVENSSRRSERIEQNNNSQNRSTDTWNNNSNNSNNSNTGGTRSNSGGGSSPRNSGGGGNTRPR